MGNPTHPPTHPNEGGPVLTLYDYYNYLSIKKTPRNKSPRAFTRHTSSSSITHSTSPVSSSLVTSQLWQSLIGCPLFNPFGYDPLYLLYVHSYLLSFIGFFFFCSFLLVFYWIFNFRRFVDWEFMVFSQFLVGLMVFEYQSTLPPLSAQEESSFVLIEELIYFFIFLWGARYWFDPKRVAIDFDLSSFFFFF